MAKQIQRVQDVLRDDCVVDLLYQINAEAAQLGVTETIRVVTHPDKDGFDIVANTPLLHLLAAGQPRNLCGLASAAQWLLDGPTIARPTPEQAEAFRHISMDLRVRDFSSPFRNLLVELQDNPTFRACLVSTGFPGCLMTNLFTRHNEYDVVSMAQDNDQAIEEFLTKHDGDEDLVTIEKDSHEGQRVALNMALALVNYGCESAPAYPKQLAEDESLAKSPGEKGDKAKKRLQVAMKQVRFTREIVIRKTTPTTPTVQGESTGRTICPHWVRGHWKMQPYGQKSALRKRVLIRPYLVHAERVNEIRPVLTGYTDKR